MRNEKYSGVYVYNKSAAKGANGKYNRHQSKSNDDIIRIDGGVPQIISKEDFDRVQRKMAERKRQTAAYAAKQEYLLSGKIICGECGCSYAGNSRRPSAAHPLYISYRCTRKNGSIKCKNPEVQRDFIEDIVLKKLADNIFSEKMIPQVLSKYNAYAAEKNTELTAHISAIRSKLAETEKGIDNIVNIVVKTGSEALSDKLKELEDNKAQLSAALEEANAKLTEMGIDEKQLRAAFRKAKQMLKNGTLRSKRAIIEQYVNTVYIYKDRITITFNISDSFTVKEDIKR